MKAIIVSGLCVFVATGCVRPVATSTEVNPGPEQSAQCDVELFSGENEVKRPYKLACLVEARGDTITNAIEEARREACACGANAMLLKDSPHPRFLLISAIRYTGPAPQPPAAAPAPGEERGACLPDRSCTGALVCASDVCVALPPPASP